MFEYLMQYSKKIVLFLITISIAGILSFISRKLTTSLFDESEIKKKKKNSLSQIDNSILFWFLGLSLFVFVMP